MGISTVLLLSVRALTPLLMNMKRSAETPVQAG